MPLVRSACNAAGKKNPWQYIWQVALGKSEQREVAGGTDDVVVLEERKVAKPNPLL